MSYTLHVSDLCIPDPVNGDDRRDLTESHLLLKQMVLNSVMAVNTCRSYARALDDLFSFASGRPLVRALLQGWKASMNALAASTVNVKLAAAWRLVSEARRNGLIGAEEASNLSDIPNVAQRGNRSFGRESGNSLTCALHHDLGAFQSCMCLSSLRPSHHSGQRLPSAFDVVVHARR